MNNSKDKIVELLAILQYLFHETDQNNVLKYLDYVRNIKKDFNIDVDRRKIMRYLEDLNSISQDEKTKEVLPFQISFSKKGKYKICRGDFFLKDEDIENIVSAIEAFQMLSVEETENLKKKIITNLSSKTQREKLIKDNSNIKTSKINSLYTKKNYMVSSSYRHCFVIKNDTRFGKTELYPNENKQHYFNKPLYGYIYKYVCYHNKPYLILMLYPERIAIAAPVQNISFLNNESDFQNDPENPYSFSFKFREGSQYPNIQKWSEKLLANETGDLQVVNLQINSGRYAKKIIASLHSYFPNQKDNMEIRKTFKNFHDMVLAGQGKEYQEVYYVENLMTDWDSFSDWYFSDINHAKEVDIITPASFAYRIADFGKKLYEKNRSVADNLFDFIKTK